MTKKNPLIIISGPTAVGKTAVSVKLAKMLGCEIISADSMQVYKKMDIGTAKITKDEMCDIPHHLIDILEPDEEFNVKLFREYAKNAIDNIYSRNHIPLMVGGTGFYIQAVLYDVNFENEDDNRSYRDELNNILNEKGAEYLFDMLKQVDEPSTHTIHMNNTKRVIRALEFYHNTGQRISEHNEIQKQKEAQYSYGYYILTDDRAKLYERIDKRVDKMVEAGLLKEVKGLLDTGLSEKNVSMQGIGYKEIIEYLNNNVSLDEAIENIKLNTKHFAKRQLTWFRREKETVFVDISQFDYDLERVAMWINNDIKRKGISV